jgi:subtilase family serine protease
VSGPLASTGSGPAGYWPVDLQNAYGLNSTTGGRGRTVAIVAAYDSPTAASDLATYRATFGLPPCAAGCFTKVDQTGGTAYPPANASWAVETSLDLAMVSASCPNCSILLVEANSTAISDLGTAVVTAANKGAVAISNSYGATEFASETGYDKYYSHPGITVTASSGDNGYGTSYPAASPYVTAVGGTSLTKSSSGSWNETAWSGAGSGCSAYEAKPAWQKDSGCSMRTVADLSVVADPATGVAFYDSTPDSDGNSGWRVAGGTSVGSPLLAGASALGQQQSPSDYPVQRAYAATTGINDVLSGSNGACGTVAPYLCTAGAGYDGPTGFGSPTGVAALAPTTSGGFSTLTPYRQLDTRYGVGGVSGPVAPGATVRLQVTGRGGVPSSGVSAVVMNVTVTQPTQPGNITVFPGGGAEPGTSNLNFLAGQSIPNLVISPVGADGTVALKNNSSGTVELIADTSGYYLGG